MTTKIEFIRPASVRGWCRAKALLKITSLQKLTYSDYFFLDSSAPHDTEDARIINASLSEIMQVIAKK